MCQTPKAALDMSSRQHNIIITGSLLINIIYSTAGGPWSPFENNWHLKADYKNYHKRQELAA